MDFVALARREFLVTAAQGTQVITNCNEADLVSAIEKGGRIIFDCDGLISLSRPIVVQGQLELDASGHNVVLDGGNSNRIFDITDAEVAITNLTIQNGLAEGVHAVATTNGATFAGDGIGGALKIVRSTVSLVRCRILNSRALGGAGASSFLLTPWFSPYAVAGSNAMGGAIFAEASALSIEGCVLSNCSALGSVGVFYHTGLGSTRCTRPGFAAGGAIYAMNSAAVIRQSTFSMCQAGATDCGGDGGAGAMRGGAISAENCQLTVEQCRFVENTASFTYGGNRGELARGGAVYMMGGEGLFTRSLFLSNSAVAGRSAPEGRSADGQWVEGFAGGGALWLSNKASIQRCSFISNRVKAGDIQQFNFTLIPANGVGGGIASFDQLFVTNSTLAFNAVIEALSPSLPETMGTAHGGAIYSGADATIAFSTIASNRLVNITNIAPYLPPNRPQKSFGGGIYQSTNGTLLLTATIFSGNEISDLATNSEAAIQDGGANIVSDFSLVVTQPDSANGLSAKIGEGQQLDSSFFFPLQSESPAVDRGAALTTAPPDLLGFPRDVPDSGAIEWPGEEARLSIRRSGTGIELQVFDPSYSLLLLEESEDLENWSPQSFNEYSPRAIEQSDARKYYRLRR